MIVNFRPSVIMRNYDEHMLPSLTKLEFDLSPKPFTITFVNFAVSGLTSVRQLLYHCYLYRGGSRSRDWRGHMASAEREPIMGVWGLCPQRGPGAEPLVRGSGGKAP